MTGLDERTYGWGVSIRMSRPVLAIVTPTFYPELVGTPHYATDIARWFSARGWRVQVVTAQPFYPEYERYPGYGRATRRDHLDDGIEILRVPTIVPRRAGPLWRAVSDANLVVQGVGRAGSVVRPDAVLSISPGAPWVVLVGRALRPPANRHVALVHDIQWGLADSLNMARRGLLDLVRTAERCCLGQADHVLALSEEMAETIRSMGTRRPVSVCPLWATVDGGPDLVERVPLDGTVQCSGSFGGKHGVSSLLTLAALLQDREPPLRLRLRGAGRHFGDLRARAERAGLANMIFEPLVPLPGLAEALARSPVHVVTQVAGAARYVMPSKVVNALACGAAVVAMTDRGSSLSRLAPVTEGLDTVEVGDAEGMCERVVGHLHAPDPAARRRRIAAAAGAMFARDRLLPQLELMLGGRPVARGGPPVAPAAVTAASGARRRPAAPAETVV